MPAPLAHQPFRQRQGLTGPAGCSVYSVTPGTDPYTSCLAINPEIRFGQPCITGTRISVADVLGWLGRGQTIPEILADFSELTPERIQAFLLYAADRERHLRIAG